MIMRSILSALITLGAASASAAPVTINAAGRELLDAGSKLYGEGKVKAAIEAYQGAAKADPASSLPASMMASRLLDVSASASGAARDALLKQAIAAARHALSLNDADPVAQEVLRVATDDAPSQLHQPAAEVFKIMQAGEALFAQKRYDEALAQYELAARRDPLYSMPWVYAGDCYFLQQKWLEAEARFRTATRLEPLNGQAWRYLSDALFQQGKPRESERALFDGIAAQPSQIPTWEKLAGHLGASGLPLKRVRLVHKAEVSIDAATGKPTVSLDRDSTEVPQSDADGTFWLSYGLRLAQAKLDAKAGKPALSPFALELAALRTAFQVDAELEAKGARAFADPALTALRKLAADGQLEPAILLLMYRESYRPEFEAWKVAHPNGIRLFVVTYGLRP